MGVMTAATGIQAGLDPTMGAKKFWASHLVTIRAELTTLFAEHAGDVGAVGLVALEAVFGGRLVNHTLAPVFGHFGVAAETDHRLAFFEYIIVG